MKVTPRIEMLEDIITNGVSSAHGGMNWLRQQHNDIPADVYLGTLEGMTTTLKGATDFIEELKKEVKS